MCWVLLKTRGSVQFTSRNKEIYRESAHLENCRLERDKLILSPNHKDKTEAKTKTN